MLQPLSFSSLGTFRISFPLPLQSGPYSCFFPPSTLPANRFPLRTKSPLASAHGPNVGAWMRRTRQRTGPPSIMEEEAHVEIFFGMESVSQQTHLEDLVGPRSVHPRYFPRSCARRPGPMQLAGGLDICRRRGPGSEILFGQIRKCSLHWDVLSSYSIYQGQPGHVSRGLL